MIAFVQGQLVEKQPSSIVVSVGGLGLQIDIPISSYEAIGGVGKDVHVFTHLSVREDAWSLFGFATTEERILFRQLISVSGIGPKLALSILSGISIADFATAIMNEDVKALSSISGVGKKTAARLAMELRESISASDPGSAIALPIASSGGEHSIINDTVMGLIALGYERADARKAVAKITAHSDEDFTAESLIRTVLQQRGR